jgi:hypothetical protein
MSRLCNVTEYLTYSGTNMLGGDEEPVSISFWYKANAAETGDCALFQLYSSSPVGLFMGRVYFTTELGAYSQNDIGGSAASATSTTPRGAWTHVLLEYASASSRTIYVNNTAATTNTTTVTQNTSVAFDLLRFGSFGGGGLGQNLYVAELAIWKKTLTSGERSTLQTSTPDNVTGAIAYWSLSSSSLVDSVNSWTLTDGGTATAYDADHPSLGGGGATWFARDRKRTYLSPWLRR